MNVGALLNSEIVTLRVMTVRGFDWWRSQLKELIPQSLRDRRRVPRQLVVWDAGPLKVVGKQGTTNRMPRASSQVVLAVPSRLAFTRTLHLPRMSSTDLRRLVELEADRLSPLPPSETIVGIEVHKNGAANGSTPVDAAVLPQGVAEQAIAAADSAGLVVTGFGLAFADDRMPRFDFMPALRERGLVSAARSPLTIWWCLVALAFLLNCAVLVIRDQQSVDQLAAITDQQAPAVAAAHAIQKRADTFDSSAQGLARQRRNHDVLAALAVVSEALPAGAWVQRFTYDGQTARLTGYKHKDVDLAAALRRDSRIAGIRLNSAQLVTDTPAGQPFDLTIVLRSGR